MSRGIQLSMLLVSNNVDIMVAAAPFCHSCFEAKAGCRILREFPINADEYQSLLRYGVQTGVRIKCVCGGPFQPQK